MKQSNWSLHRTIKTKPIDVKSGTHFGLEVESSDKDPNFEVDDHVRTSKI